MAYFDLKTYKLYVKMSHEKHLLVEGRDDKQFFLLLFDELAKNALNPEVFSQLKIETAQIIDAEFGNREKVEMLCEDCSSEEFSGKFVGFVDREDRDFFIGSRIIDRIEGHSVQGNLIWSRGHSIENYFFDISIIEEPLRSLSATHHFRQALTLFRGVFENALRIACAIGIVAMSETGNWKRITSCIDFDYFEINSSTMNININTPKWIRALQNRGYTENESKNIIANYKKNYKVANNTDFSVIQWFCHGHIGLSLLRHIYARCLMESPNQGGNNPEREARKGFLRVSEDHVFNSFASSWAKMTVHGDNACPQAVLKSLNLYG